MLPPSLVSVYQQYKEDTNAVASWLASTAKSRGYPADLLSGATSQATVPEHSKRLKGKARKQAKAAAQQPKDSSSNSSNPDYIIAIKDFIPLAEFVAAAKKPVVSVPLSFANTLNRVISARSGFRTRLSELSDSSDVSADSTHSYFVGVLEKVREVLTPRFSAATRDEARPPSPLGPVGEVGGRFAGLSVEEPSEEFLSAPDIERPVPVKDDEATYAAEPQQDLVEVLFAYALLMNDLGRIRHRIEWIWTNYREDGLELVAAAIATNTACDLARNLMEDMAPMFRAHGSAIRIARHFYFSQCMAAGFSYDDIKDFANESNYESYEIATKTYMIAFNMLEKFLHLLEPDALPIYNDGEFGTYDPTRDWKAMSKQEKYQQDDKLTRGLFTETAIVARWFIDYPVYDEFIRGMQELDRTREIPMYLAFATQILLDIHHILGGKVYSAQQTFMTHLGFIDEDLALHEGIIANFRFKKSVAHIDQAIKKLRTDIKWVQDDHVRKVKVRIIKELGIICTAPSHRLLKDSPVVSGLMLYRYRTTMYNLSLGLVNAMGSITCSAHLCNALRQEKIMPQLDSHEDSWEDITAAMALLGTDSFFVGFDLPSNRENYIKNLLLQMGLTVSTFSNGKDKHRQTHKGVKSKGKVRGIKRDCAPVSDMFYDRYVRNTGQVDWTPEHVDRVLSRALHTEEGSEEEGSLVLRQTRDPEKLREHKRNNEFKASKKTENAARMSPEQLIRSLTSALEMESLTVAFPYLALHRATWGVLHKVREACKPFLVEKKYASEWIVEEDKLPSVVCIILSELVKGDDRLFVKAGEVVRDQ